MAEQDVEQQEEIKDELQGMAADEDGAGEEVGNVTGIASAAPDEKPAAGDDAGGDDEEKNDESEDGEGEEEDDGEDEGIEK